MPIDVDNLTPDDISAILEDVKSTKKDFADAYGDLLAHIADLEDLRQKLRARIVKEAGKAGFVNGARFKVNVVKQSATRFKSAPLMEYLTKNKLLKRFTYVSEGTYVKAVARNSEGADNG